MERHNVLILSNLDTVEHLEIGIWLISDKETEGTLLRQKKGDGSELDSLFVLRRGILNTERKSTIANDI